MLLSVLECGHCSVHGDVGEQSRHIAGPRTWSNGEISTSWYLSSVGHHPACKGGGQEEVTSLWWVGELAECLDGASGVGLTLGGDTGARTRRKGGKRAIRW